MVGQGYEQVVVEFTGKVHTGAVLVRALHGFLLNSEATRDTTECTSIIIRKLHDILYKCFVYHR